MRRCRVLSLLPLLAACAAGRQPPLSAPSATSAPAAAAPVVEKGAPVPDGVTVPEVDLGPVDVWYKANASKVELNPAASADDLSFGLNLIGWVVEGDDAAWSRMARRVTDAFSGFTAAIKPPFQGDHRGEAASYHQAGTPLSQKPREQRDAALETRVYAKAVLLDPGNADLYNHMAIAASIAEKYETAERWAMLAIAIDPSFLAAYQELSYVYKNTARYRDAVALVDRAVKLDGDIHTKAMLLARKGQSLWMLSEEAEALKAFQTAKRLGGPAWVDSYLNGQQTLGKAFVEPPSPPAGEAVR